jgi:hypothetical protein
VCHDLNVDSRGQCVEAGRVESAERGAENTKITPEVDPGGSYTTDIPSRGCDRCLGGVGPLEAANEPRTHCGQDCCALLVAAKDGTVSIGEWD